MRSHRLRGCYQIAIIGGNGFIGRALISRLSIYPNLRIFSIDKRHNNVWLDISKSKAIVQQIHMDVSAPGSIQTWLSGSHVDVVIYAAGYENPPIGVWESSLLEIESIEGLNYALRGLSKLDLNKSEERPYFMYLSSWTVYGDGNNPHLESDREFPSNHVGISKLLGEDLVKRLCTKYGCPWCIVRPTEVFGKRHNNELGKKSYWAGYLPYVVDSVLCKNQEIKIWNNNYNVDLVHINYVSKVLLHLIENKTEGIYNISSGMAINLSNLLGTILDVYGNKELDTRFTPSNLNIDKMNICPTKVQELIPYDRNKYSLISFLRSYIPVRRYELAKNLAVEDIFLEPLTLDTTTLQAKEAFEARKERRRLSYSKIKEIAGPEFFKLNIGAIQTRAKELLIDAPDNKEIGEKTQKSMEDMQVLLKSEDIEKVEDFSFNSKTAKVDNTLKRKRKSRKSAKFKEK